MSSIKLSIAEIVKNFNEDVGKYDDILDAFYKNSMPLCEHIRSILQSKEDLKVAYSDLPDSTTILLADPKTMNYSKELIAWSIAILAASWAEWVFTSKSNDDSLYQTDPAYQDNPERKAAKVNVKITLPYVFNSIIDVMTKAKEIESYKKTNYEPDPDTYPSYIDLRK